jgi:hypothetical protein
MTVSASDALVEETMLKLYARSVGIVCATPSLYGAVPLFDSRNDDQFVGLAEFQDARTCLGRVDVVVGMYGVNELNRLLLWFVFDIAENYQGVVRSFESVFSRFIAELTRSSWHFVTVARLGNVKCDPGVDQADLGGDVTVRRASPDWADSLDPAIWPILAADFYDGVRSEWLIVANTSVPKTPDTVALSDHVGELRIREELRVLRLSGDGWIHKGRSVTVRRSEPFVLGGTLTSGTARQRAFLGEYHIRSDAGAAAARRATREALARCQPMEITNVETAVRRFESVFERELWFTSDQVLDAMTAVEALVGDREETTHKVVTRVAYLLGNTDDEVVDLYSKMKEWYRLRSLIAHGGEITSRFYDSLRDPSPLVQIARQLIRGFVQLTASAADYKTSSEFRKFKDDIDATLIHGGNRAKLRKRMGLA